MKIKKYQTLIFHFIFFGGLLISSCTIKTKKIPIYNIPNELRSSFQFDTGSYWIYQDSISNAYDTLECISHYTHTLVYSRKPEYSSESIEYHIKSRNSNRNYEYSLGEDRWYDHAPYFELHPSFHLFFPFEIGQIYFDDILNSYGKDPQGNEFTDTSRLISIFDSYSFNTFSFNKVIVVDVVNDKILYGLHTQYYYAEGVGLIQCKNFNDNTNYKLIEYYIE